MDQVLIWCVASLVGAISLNTIWRIYCERDRFLKDELSDADSALAWQIVFFVVLPLLTLFDFRTTSAVCEFAGGYLSDVHYALLWYQAVPAALSARELFIPALFSGTAAELLLVLLLLPALAFRPHPFLAMLVGYTAVFVPAVDLVLEPVLAILGLGNPKWLLATTFGDPHQVQILLAIHVVLALIFLVVVRSNWVTLSFASLTRPTASDKLKATQAAQDNIENPKTACYLALLYESAGLRSQAKAQLKRMKKLCGDSVFTTFVDAYLAYRQREYRRAATLFLTLSDSITSEPILKGSLLAACACSSFAQGDLIKALNFCERALEFDHHTLVARMVKVDVFLRQGKKDQAGSELLVAMQLGLTQELESRIPLDAEATFRALSIYIDRKAAKQAIYAVQQR